MGGLVEILKRYPIAIGCALLALVGVGLIVMRGDVLGEVQREEEQLQSRIKIIDTNSKQSKGIEEDVAKLEEYIELLDGRIFDREKRAINTNFFYAFGEDMDVSITNVSQRREEPKLFAKSGPNALSLHSTIGYDISVVGKYGELIKFMHKFFVVDSVARVTSFSLSPSNTGAGGADPSLKLSMEVVVLSKKD